MADTAHLHHALLRPAIIHILRAAGFHSTRPSVLDALTDLSARYFLLLAQRTAQFAAERESLTHGDEVVERIMPIQPSTTQSDTTTASSNDTPIPTLPDILIALTTTSTFSNTLTPSEEAWRETLRRPLSTYPSGAAREKERRRRDTEDVRDVRDFVDWCIGPIAREERRIASLEIKESDLDMVVQPPTTVGITAANRAAAQAGADVGAGEGRLEKVQPDDYIALMKKKYSRTGDGARYAGTVLGRHGRDAADEVGRNIVKIEGPAGVPESLMGWKEEFAKRRKVEAEEDMRLNGAVSGEAG